MLPCGETFPMLGATEQSVAFWEVQESVVDFPAMMAPGSAERVLTGTGGGGGVLPPNRKASPAVYSRWLRVTSWAIATI